MWFGFSPAAKSHSSVPGRVERSIYAAAQQFGTEVADEEIVDNMCACSDWLECCVRYTRLMLYGRADLRAFWRIDDVGVCS